MAWVFNPFTGTFDFTNTGGGGGGSPGGSSGQVQYNNGGAFGGMSGTTWDNANQSLALVSTGTGTGVTASNPVLNLSQTWNAAGVQFTGLLFTATNTASDQFSKLIDLKVGANTIFQVSRFPNMTIASGGTNFFDVSTSALSLAAATSIQWGSTSNASGTADTFLRRATTATIQLGAADVSSGAVAQTLQVQSNTGATTTGANFNINASKGTTASGSIIFNTGPTATFGATLTIGSNKVVTFNEGGSYVNSGGTFVAAAGTSGCAYANSGLFLNSISQIRWSNTSNDWSATTDLILVRDAANTLALRNGTNAQTFRVYNTYSSAADYERVSLFGAGTYFGLFCEKAGAGQSRTFVIQGTGDININAGASSALTFAPSGSTAWQMSSAGHFLAWTDNTYDIGASGGNRPRRLYVAGGSLTGSAADSSIEISPTWNTSGTPTAIKLNVTNTASASGSFLMSLQTGGTNQFAIKADNGACYIGVPTSDLNNYTLLTLSNDLYVNSKSVTAGGIRMCHGTYEFAYFKAIGTTSARLQLGANTPFGWTDNAAAASGTFDTILSRAGVATLQLGAADVSSGNAVAQFLRVQSTTAASQTAPNFTIQGSRGTTAGGGIIFQTAATNTQATALQILANKSIVVGDGANALATTATDGFLYIPTCAGAPTGTPTTQTGTAPMVADSTTNKLYVYLGGAWTAMN